LIGFYRTKFIEKYLDTPPSYKVYGFQLPEFSINRIHVVAYIRNTCLNSSLTFLDAKAMLEKCLDTNFRNNIKPQRLSYFTRFDEFYNHSERLSWWEYQIGEMELFEIQEYFEFFYGTSNSKYDIYDLFEGMGISPIRINGKYKRPINPILLKVEKEQEEQRIKSIAKILTSRTQTDNSKPKSAEMTTPTKLSSTESSNSVNTNWTYHELKQMLDEVVIGQEEAKSDALLTFYQHQLRLKWLNPSLKGLNPVQLPKSNLLLVGPSGSGKTLIVETLSGYFNVPYVRIDCSSLVCSGFVGVNLSDQIIRFINTAGSLEKAQNGVMFFDEFDKISNYHTKNSSDIGTSELQQEFLTLIEGKNFSYHQRKSNSDITQGVFDASNVQFIFGGSFYGINDILKRKTQRSIGFGAETELNSNSSKITSQDLIDFGIIPELVGRIGCITQLKPLRKSDMIEIIKHSEMTPLKQYYNFFELSNNKFHVEAEVFEKIADELIEKNLGARYLNTMLQLLFKDFQKQALISQGQHFRIDLSYYAKVFEN
jgi:ATP-dependent Clp protease ATP-binding subunit ClpX